MAKYLIRAKYNVSGIQGAVKEGFAAREAHVRGLIEAGGGKTEAFYFTWGDQDVVGIVECDQAAAIAFSLAVNQSGAVSTTTTPLITAAEMDAGRAKLPQYRAPGA